MVINKNKIVSSPIFWFISLLCVLIISFVATKSTSISLLLMIGIIIFPIVWKTLLDQRFTLILILLSILPGMLGRFTTAPKSGTAILLTDLLIVALMVGFMLRKITIDRKWLITKLHGYILLFFTLACISYFYGIYHLYDLGTIEFKELVVSFLYLMRWLGYATIFFYLVEKIKNIKDVTFWFKALMWITFLTAIGGFLQLIFYPDFFNMFVLYGWDPHKGRLLGTFFDPNLIGAFFALNLCVILGVIMNTKRYRKILIFILITVLVALALTLSRSAYVGFAVGFMFLTLYKSRTLLFIGFLSMLLVLTLNPTIFNRISQGISIDDSAAKHIESWVDGAKLIRTYPLTGIGYNMLPSVYSDLALIDEWDINNKSGIENSLFTIWVTTGILGVLSYILIWLSICIKAFQNWKNTQNDNFIRGINFGMIGGIISLFISSIFVNILLFSYVVVFCWIYAAIAFAKID